MTVSRLLFQSLLSPNQSRQRISLSKIKRHPFIQREYRHCKRTAMVDDSE